MRSWEPCAPAQIDVWLAERLGDLGASYHLAFGFEITGSLDIGALESACHALLRRHPILLTCYPDRGGEPACAPVEQPWRLERLSGTGAGDEVVRRWLTTRFDLARGPLVRTALMPTGADRQVLLFACHHLVFDGLSRDIAARDLAVLYNAAVRGADPGLPPLPRYARYVDWLQPSDGDLPPGWQEVAALAADPVRLSDGFRAAGLPGDRTVEVALPPEVRSALSTLADAGGGSLFSALAATVTVVLDKCHRGTGGSPPVVTIPCNTRPPEYAGSAGLFVNELPLRVPAAPGGSFRHHLTATAHRLRQALALRLVPLAELVRRHAGRDRDPASRVPPAAGIVLGYRRVSTPPAWVGLDVRYLRWLPTGASRAEVELQLIDDGTQVTGWLSCDPARLGGGAAGRLAELWREAVRWLVATPDRPLRELCLLDPLQRRQVVAGWNRTRVPRRSADAVLARFAAQVAATPAAVALVTGGRRSAEPVRYAELNRRANRLAHRLRALGAGPETLVAVCVERSPELVVALLGTLKAGAAYLPLDPEHPPARLAFLRQDSQARILVMQRALRGLLPAAGADRLVLLDDPAALAGQPDTDPTPVPDSGHPAYAIYTSGSTGTPKAALISHAAISNQLAWMQERYRLTGDDRVLLKTSAGFDVSVWELFWPLLAGARIVLARPGGQRDASYLVDLINQAGVTTLQFVPSMLDAFLEHPGSGTCRSVRRVISIGEELPARLVRRFHHRFTTAELHNLYGPTEATVAVSSWPCGPDPDGVADRVPIGRPIANTQLYILDPDLQPVPVGAAGELYLGGVGLARGYAGRPGLTAARFVANPLRGDGSRLYRTGDLARYRDDGAVEFLGRIDHQLKVRGSRVEPAEIERALSAHPQVRQAVVVARDGAGHREADLVGYVVPAGPAAAPDEADLLAGLRRQLPDYLVPAAIVPLEALPLTPNGKLDRRALPDPPAATAPGYRPPGSAAERLVAQVWSDLFGTAPVGADDDFFALGGHSLLATRTVARLQEVAGVDLPVRAVFEHPTVRALAAAVEQAQAAMVSGERASDDSVDLRPGAAVAVRPDRDR